MNPFINFDKIEEYLPVYSLYRDNLANIFRKMDETYEAAASSYGFICSGCENSCCWTRFYHYTLIEFFYLFDGFQALNPIERQILHTRSFNAVSKMESPLPGQRVMCPLNEAGRCGLYVYRPMICRLHGIPHELNHPLKGRCRGPGCCEFENRCGDKPYIPFDRTQLYSDLAEIEKTFRLQTGWHEKIRMTIAEILLCCQG